MIEFALVLIPLLLLTVGITEIGRFLWYYDALQKAVRDGARCASLSTLSTAASTDPACLQMVRVEARAAGVPYPDAWPVGYSGDAAKPEYVTVSVSGFQMPWIWSIGDSLPAPGETSAMSMYATMPYMK